MYTLQQKEFNPTKSTENQRKHYSVGILEKFFHEFKALFFVLNEDCEFKPRLHILLLLMQSRACHVLH